MLPGGTLQCAFCPNHSQCPAPFSPRKPPLNAALFPSSAGRRCGRACKSPGPHHHLQQHRQTRPRSAPAPRAARKPQRAPFTDSTSPAGARCPPRL
jgi:hypothetical protein